MGRYMLTHFYNNPQFGENWFDYDDVYRLMVENCQEAGHIVEIGSWRGRSASFLIIEAKNKSPKIRIDLVDHFMGSPEHSGVTQEFLFSEITKNLSPLNGLYNIVKKPSLQASMEYKDNSLDGVFIDGNHEYENVKADILAWMPKIRKGGILAGHDYCNGWQSVVRAVNDTLKDFKILKNSWVKQC